MRQCDVTRDVTDRSRGSGQEPWCFHGIQGLLVGYLRYPSTVHGVVFRLGIVLEQYGFQWVFPVWNEGRKSPVCVTMVMKIRRKLAAVIAQEPCQNTW